jgi:hypothetical protein
MHCLAEAQSMPPSTALLVAHERSGCQLFVLYLKSGMPADVDMPAPVMTTILEAFAICTPDEVASIVTARLGRRSD